MTARITLDQWRALVAVVDAGGYAQAAELIHKSQSTVTYAVQKIEHLLGLRAFEIRGRKAQLTPAGATLYRRARTLLEEAEALERGARSMAQGWAPSLRLAVEAIFPTWLLLQCFNRFALERPEIHIQLHETVLGGTVEALTEGRVDFAICSHVPEGFASDRLMRIRFIAAAHADHPLHQLGRPLTHDDLRPHRQLVIRDSAQQRILDSGVWLGADQRWTVSHKATSIAAATMGMGFAWYPAETIQGELASGVLKPLPLIEGAERFAELYLVFAERDCRGRAPVRMAEIIREGVESLWPD
ncbi:MAG: LysR family transcriptional regulator [Gammaproteobacteria bacterium]|jgi:DNA-binding transcriptional LysR family regulator|nr:LysR family transcriptional regulator [Gammaproteobacteria bacterium]